MKVSVEVENTGKAGGRRSGATLSAAFRRGRGPIRSLEGFQRIALRAGERKDRAICSLARAIRLRIRERRQARHNPGTFEISVGGSSRDSQGPADASRPALSPAIRKVRVAEGDQVDSTHAGHQVQAQIQGASSEVVRDINRRIVLNLIRTRHPISRADLARVSGLQRSTISLIVEQLIEERWVLEGPTGRLPRGRRPTFLRLNDERVIIGVDIRPTQTTVALADANGHFISQEIMATSADPEGRGATASSNPSSA